MNDLFCKNETKAEEEPKQRLDKAVVQDDAHHPLKVLKKRAKALEKMKIAKQRIEQNREAKKHLKKKLKKKIKAKEKMNAAIARKDDALAKKLAHEKFPKDEAYDIVTKNPGILANKAGDLRSSSAGEIRSSMQFVTAFDDVPKEIRTLIPPATAILIVTSIATRLYQCQGGVCG